VVFDPLAVILLLASQYSFQWFRKQEEETPEIVEAESVPEEPEAEPELTQSWPEPNPLWPFPSAAYMTREENIFDVIKHNEIVQEAPYQPGYEDVTVKDDAGMQEETSKLEEWNTMLAEAEKAVNQERELEDTEILASAPDTEAQAMTAWKHDNPNSSLKFQRQLLEKGIIDQLPWQNYLKPQADFVDEAAVEAKKWAEENPNTEESAKAKEWAEERGVSDVSWMEHDEQGNQIKRIKENYQQNAEQNERTIWQRIQDAKK